MFLSERPPRRRWSRTHLTSSSLWAAHDGNSTDIRPTPPRRLPPFRPVEPGSGCSPAPLGGALDAPGTGREMDRFRCAQSVRRPDREAGCPDRIRRLRQVGACAPRPGSRPRHDRRSQRIPCPYRPCLTSARDWRRRVRRHRGRRASVAYGIFGPHGCLTALIADAGEVGNLDHKIVQATPSAHRERGGGARACHGRSSARSTRTSSCSAHAEPRTLIISSR